MATVRVQPAGTVFEVSPGTTLFDALVAAGVDVETPCGGVGTCGRCLVRVVEGDVRAEADARLPEAARARGVVLACRAEVGEGPLTVEVAEPPALDAGHLADADTALYLPELPAAGATDPFTHKRFVQVVAAQREDGLGDIDRVQRALGEEAEATLYALGQTALAVREEEGRVTVTLDGRRLLAVEAGDATERHYGLAVDIGTTTVAVQLIDLAAGRILGTRSDYNAQMACGDDVISRINYAASPERLAELRARVLGTINGLVTDVAFGSAVNPLEISSAVVSGNTVMTHLFLGLPPEQIRLDPYTPTVLTAPVLTGADVGLAINPGGGVRLSPCVGSYVGGDITAGLLTTALPESDALSMFIDIGTNGELVIGNAEVLMACACSAGPAFEGGGIECGVRATTGAIDRVEVDAETGEAHCQTIGGAPPQGVCGSGMIDLVANLLLTGWLDRAGRLERERSSPAILVDGKRARYRVAPGFAITETEIENIVRAKAAIYSAAGLLLEQLGASFADLAAVYVAGGFGRFLDLHKAVVLGLLPDIPRDRFHYLGNASLLGSYMVASSREVCERQLALADRITYVELSTEPAYMDQYTAATFLPHTDLSLFPSVAAALGIGVV